MILVAVALGLLIGLSLGALGGGGSVLTVPALVFALGLSAQEATAGSLIIVGVSSSIACVGHARAGHTRWGPGFVLAAFGVPASLVGTHLNTRVDPDALLLAFAALVLVAASGMLLQGRAPEDDDPTPAGSGGTALRTRPVLRVGRGTRLALAGLGIGFLTGFLGVGGGFVIVPVLVMALGFEMPVAVGTSLLVIALNSGVALASRAQHGTFVWSVIVPFALAALVGSMSGERVAERLPSRDLTRGFAVLLLLVGCFVGAQAVLGLS